MTVPKPAETSRSESAPRRYGRGDLVRFTLGPITNRGQALAHTPEGQAVFVSFGAPGEEVVAAIDSVHKDRLTAHVVEVLIPSPGRVLPLCPYFGTCGGCNYQHLAYEVQLEVKRDVVVETLRRIGRFDALNVLPTLPSPSPWFYRNQMRLSTNRWGDVGLTRRLSHDVIPLNLCFIAHPSLGSLLPKLQGKGAGLHQIVLRTGVHTGDVMISPDLSDRGLSSVTGDSLITEVVAGKQFRISPSAFFQVNSEQAETMVRLLRALLRLNPADVLADLYAGVGFFSKLFAGECRDVYAVEVSPLAARDAEVNLDGLANVHYVLGEVEKVLPMLPAHPNKILLDPSREGCQPRAIDALIAAEPERLVYVSCDAATLARDLRRLVDGGFVLEEIQPLDMFPQTHHIECIAALSWPAPNEDVHESRVEALAT